jgi:ABC-type glycerol-3-phosphate transport system substrate-binding protein
VSYLQFNEALGAENVCYFQPPGFSDDTPSFLPVGAQIAWATTSFAEDKDLAWAYTQFITSSEAMQLQFEKGGVIPNDTTVTLSDDAPPQVLGFVKDYAAKPVQLPMDAIVQVAVYEEFIRQINLVLQGESSLADALAATDKVAKRAIAEGQ